MEFLHLKWTKIAEVMGVSRQTLYRRVKEKGIHQDLQFSDISDHDLDEVIKQIKVEHPNDGEVLMNGHLAAKNVWIPSSKLRAAIHRFDPINTLEQRSTTAVRRVYHVDEPNDVWHFDGHHKLIRWRLVTHGGVDGHSRMITFLHYSTNNTASTDLSVFTTAVQKYGLPQRVCSDLGGENVYRCMENMGMKGQ